MEQISKSHGQVLYIEDPNRVNLYPLADLSVQPITNSVGQYQDMNIFAELTAVRKGRSVIVNGKGLQSMDSVEVNFLGNNQNKNNPNHLNFTTNYYDGSSGANEIQYEAFGITSIKVLINSSFIPQVSIQFVDIRGLSFFNQENSPYRILFDFPPPIFNLKIKGYYGRTLSYQLHLVKYTTEFKAENGNFIIDAQFVATTFAPLSDILFRYAINFPLMDATEISMNPEPGEPPRNTNEMILKLRSLYAVINEQLKTGIESQQFDNAISELENNTAATSALVFYKEALNDNGTPFMFTFINNIVKQPYSPTTPINYVSADAGLNAEIAAHDVGLLNYMDAFNSSPPADYTDVEIIPLVQLSDYDKEIKAQGTNLYKLKVDNRLYVGYIVGNNDTTLYNALVTYRTKLLNNAKTSGINTVPTDISMPQNVYSSNNLSTNTVNPTANIKYKVLDITNYYTKLYKQKLDILETKNNAALALNVKINAMIEKELGMRPTIYNIFKIILNDVDKFYDILRDTSRAAEDHHEKYKSLIAGGQVKDSGSNDSGSVDGQDIYAFPLIIKLEGTGCNNKEVRVSPVEINKTLPDPFPELELIVNFIETFTTQKKVAELANMKADLDEDGNNKWIPISPIDSTMSGRPAISPYGNIDSGSGINVDADNKLNETLKIFLNRFYMLTQSSLPDAFYTKTTDASNAYVQLYSKSEAINLASSIYSPILRENLASFAKANRTDVTTFYDYLDKNSAIFEKTYDFADDSVFVINEAYVDKNNDEYEGMFIYTSDIEEQVFTKDGKKPFDVFAQNVQRPWYKLVFKGRLPDASYLFTKQNIIYVIDKYVQNAEVKEDKLAEYEGTTLQTRYLCPLSRLYTDNNIVRFYEDNTFAAQAKDAAIKFITLQWFNTSTEISSWYKDTLINSLLVKGNNTGFGDIELKANSKAFHLRRFQSIVDVWVYQLAAFDTQIYDDVISQVSDLSATIILSNFGYTIGPFNNFPNKLGELIFQNPAAIDVPRFLPAYIGALIEANESGLTDKLKDFFNTGGGKNLSTSGVFIFADIHDINTYLSDIDKIRFREAYRSFFINDYPDIRTNLEALYDLCNSSGVKDKYDEYESYLNPESENNKNNLHYFSSILKTLLNKTTIVSFSQNTFKDVSTPTAYKALKKQNIESPSKRAINDSFFKLFFQELDNYLIQTKKEQDEQDEEQKKLSGDEDILTQTYYSFKNINDKWLTNPENENPKGYPFNDKGKRLIDMFAFVDRAMNPAGDTCINPEILIDMFEDTTLSLFSVISQILSTNGFEFFPLQNFMNHSKISSWDDTFKIDPIGEVEKSQAFVCMYVGGASSYPSNINNGFQNDGIIDLTTTDAKDFFNAGDDCSQIDSAYDEQLEGNTDFPYRQVRAFRVKFGEQNQSMFSDIKIDSKEYPETNESIQILARLAGDGGKNAPIPKGQNLYNLYENRAYKATITGLGNAMIQPTQYFQLDNVPIYNGAYLILGVEHSIEPNKMTTSFYGTKILRYPVPRVLDPAAVMGFEGATSPTTDMTTGEFVKTGSQSTSMSHARLAQLNSVYGVDVSYANAEIDWEKAVNPTNPDDPKVSFAFIKATQGTATQTKPIIDSQFQRNFKMAKAAGVKITYYHFGEPYTGSDPVGNATAQAEFFLDTIKALNAPKPDFPLALDFENKDTKKNPTKWTYNKANNDLWINTFVQVLKDNGYDTILYSNRSTINEKTSNNFGKLPLWFAEPKEKPQSSEMNNPSIPKGWKDWSVWQFSWQGRVNGIKGDVDINAMRKGFFDNPKA